MTDDPRFRGSPRSLNLQGPLPAYDPKAALNANAARPPTLTISGKTYLVHTMGERTSSSPIPT